MTDMATNATAAAKKDMAQVRVRRRYAAERRFQWLCLGALAVAGIFLVILLISIVSRGYSAFVTTELELSITFSPDLIDAADPSAGNYRMIVAQALQERFPAIDGTSDLRKALGLVSNGAYLDLKQMVTDDPSLIGTTEPVTIPVASDVDMYVKGYLSGDVDEGARRLDDRQLGWIDALDAEGAVTTVPNWEFFTHGDSREPELAGIGGALVGSALTLIITFLVSFPMGVAAAIYLEEFAPKKRWVDIIEVNINNLAAVPSIVFGLLGLAVFLNLMNLPRSAPLVGGLTLALMTLPTIIITTRAALKGVPPSIREAATGLGASPVQVVFHHVMSLAMPRVLTGTIIGMAQALGETAPLLMIGMVAFIVDIPHGPMDAATVLPVQIYLWADSPERGFVEKTSAAIMVLLGFLIFMNGIAVYLRQRFEVRW
jgi:phosphate transport system permease protein